MKRHSRKAEEVIKQYQRKIETAKKFRQSNGTDDTFRRMIDLYRGKHWARASKEDQIVINMSKTIIDTILPAVALNNPSISVAARDSTDEDRATISEAVINYQFQHFNYKDELNLALMDSLIMGVGFIKCGWRFVEEETSRDPAAMAADFQQLAGQVDDYLNDNPEAEGSTASDEQIAASIPATEYAIVADHPFVERVSPFDIFLDPTATQWREVGWICQRVWRPLEEAQADPRYDTKARGELKAGGRDKYGAADASENRGASIFNRQSDDTCEVVCIWEWYDLRSGLMAVFGDDAGRFLVKPTPQPYKFGHPFEWLPNFQIPEFLYPMGELESIEELQYELNRTRSQLMNHRKKSIRKYLIKKGALSAQAIGVLTSDVDNSLIEVNDGYDLREILTPLPDIPVSADLYQGRDQIVDDFSMVSGMNDYQLGINGSTRKTATESSIINDVANGRADAKRMRYEQFCAKVARKLMMLDQQFVTGEQVARISGQDGAQYWLPFTIEDILGEFDFEVEFGSTQPMNQAGARREAQDFAMAVAPFVGTVVDPYMVARKIIAAFGEKNPGSFLLPQQPLMPPGMPPGPPGADGGPMSPPGATGPTPTSQQTPRDLAQQGVSPQQAQLAGQVGLQSPDMHQ